ncbi:MAG: fibronectin type III domain protein [Treponematales bacterium]
MKREKIYFFVYDGASLALDPAEPVSISVLSAHGYSVPTGLTAVAASSTRVNLSWNAAAGATSYYVYRSETADGNYTEITSVTGTSYSNTGLQSGTAYYYKVCAYYSTGVYGGLSATVSAATPVDAPTGIAAAALSTSEIRLTWNAVTTGAERYYLYTAANSGGPWTELTHVSAAFYTHSGLSAGTAYYYKVRAYRNGVYSAYSAVVSAIPPTSGLFIQNKGFVSGVASPFSIANALLWLKTNVQANTAYTILINADETLAPQTLSQANLNNKKRRVNHAQGLRQRADSPVGVKRLTLYRGKRRYPDTGREYDAGRPGKRR